MSATPTAVDGLTLRAATTDDWPAIAAIVNAARRADNADEVATAEGIASELADRNLERDIVIAEVDGAAIGYGCVQLAERDGVLTGDLSGAVLPSFRRRGIGTVILHRTRDAVITQMAEDPRQIPREIRVFALDSEIGIISMVTAEGFVPVRFGFEMRRPLTGRLPDHPLPDGLELRPLVEADYRAVFEANEEAFRDHWGHRAPVEDDFRREFYGPDVTPALWCVAWEGDQVAGVVMNAIYAKENEVLGIRRGWLDRVSVRRPWRGRGVAKALCSASFRVLRDAGMEEACLGVDGSNASGAVQLYEGLGFHVARGWKAYGRPADAPASPGWHSAGDRATIGG